MGTPDGYTNCEQITSYYTHYPVLIAALLWCGVPIEQVEVFFPCHICLAWS